MRERSRNATSGDTSSGPNSGSIRLSGANIHSVSTYDHRIHLEYGEILNHVEITRTISAIRRTAKVQEISITPNRPGLLTPQRNWRKNRPRNSSTVTRSSPPTTTTTSVHHG